MYNDFKKPKIFYDWIILLYKMLYMYKQTEKIHNNDQFILNDKIIKTGTYNNR